MHPRLATLIIDMQVDFFDHERLRNNRSALAAHTNELAEATRQHETPVIWVRTEFAPDLHDAFLEVRKAGRGPVISGTEGAKFLPELQVRTSDIVLLKKRYSAFFNTSLDETLKTFRCSGVIIAGINTHACVRTTAIDAYQRDYEVLLARDCIDSYDLEHHQISWRYMDGKHGRGMTNVQLLSLLGNTAA